MSREDFEATRSFLLNYSKLWVQTSRGGWAMRSTASSTAGATWSPSWRIDFPS